MIPMSLADSVPFAAIERSPTMTEQVADAIVRAAVEGRIALGERVVEAELARRFNVSRVPVREALRLLESRGIVVNTPYRGVRLVEVDARRVEQMLEVRGVLEQHAAALALPRLRRDPELIAPFREAMAALEAAYRKPRPYQLALRDTAYHRALVGMSGNPELVQLWETLALRLTVVVGLASHDADHARRLAMHRALYEAFERRDSAEVQRQIRLHIADGIAVGWRVLPPPVKDTDERGE
jgi:DNA-binding GntR family transcriptional regulator